jgi:hypothetical protein
VLSGAAGTPVTLAGGGGFDYLIGPDVATRWSITGPDAGRLANLGLGGPLGSPVAFSAVGTLIGGADTDRFVFSEFGLGGGGSLTGYIDGGAGVNNQLDYSD